MKDLLEDRPYLKEHLMPVPTQFPDTLDTNALQLVWDAWRGTWPEDKAAAGLALWNIAGYAAGKALGQPEPTVRFGSRGAVAAAEPTDEEVDAAFTAALEPQQDERRSRTLAAFVPWGLIFSVAIELLKKWLASR